jgi:hypothetical protein
MRDTSISSKIEILQNNTDRIPQAMHTSLELAFKATIDFVLIQEPWIANDNMGTVSHPAYITILPNKKDNIRPRVAIFARKDTKFSYTARPDIIDDPDILILQISGPGLKPIQLINLYNEKGLGNDSDYTVKRSLQYLVPDKRTIISGDFNAHHSWWNSTISSPTRCEELTPWLGKYGFELKNAKDIATFHRKNAYNHSIIDLTFATKDIESQIEWYIEEEACTGSHHEILRISIATELTEYFINLIEVDRYNLKKADWKRFREILLNAYPTINNEISEQDLDTEIGLDMAAKILEEYIHQAADIAIPKMNICYRSKPWWNDDIDLSRKKLSQLKRVWKKDKRDPLVYKAYLVARNSYFAKIKEAKQGLWNSFLENAKGKEIFKAFQYTKYSRVERIPIIEYKNKEGQEIKAIDFKEKSTAFLETLFPKPPSTSALNWTDYRSDPTWEWPNVEREEIKKAIFSSSIKKAPGPDRISFKII